MARKAYALWLFAATIFAAEPVNQDADLTLDLLEFLAEFGAEATTVPVGEDELESINQPDDEGVPKMTHVATESERGQQK